MSIQRMVLALDAGDVLWAPHPIGLRETSADLFERLADLGAEAAVEALDLIEGGAAVYTPQDPEGVTAPKLSKDDGRIDFGLDPASISRHVRAMTTWPGARTRLPDGRDLVVLEAEVVEATERMLPPPPERSCPARGSRSAPARGPPRRRRLRRVKPAGKGAADDTAFLNGARLARARLG